MRKSLVQWLRKLVLMGIASASLLTTKNIYAHDLPIFDSLTPLNCFGIGSCGFPIDGRQSELPVRPELKSPADVAALDSPNGWSFADCFGNACQDPLGQSALHEVSSLGPDINYYTADEAGDWSDENVFFEQQSEAFESSWSYPVSSLSLIQAIGIQVPKFDLNETLKLFPKAILDLYQDRTANSDSVGESTAEVRSYLSSRPLVDDYLGDESFVRDWRSDQSYRGLNRLDYIQHEPASESLAVAVPKRPPLDAGPWLATILASIGEFQCCVSQELQDFALTGHYSQQAGKSLANFELKSVAAINESAFNFSNWAGQAQVSSIQSDLVPVDELFGQPAFVIYEVDGKEFLLPAKQARHWNCVPSVPSRTSVNAQPTPTVDFASTKSIIVSELANSVSNGLELVASKLQQYAGHLRAVAHEESQIANRSEVEGIR